MFRWTPPALPQVTFCQLRLLRLPRSSPLLLFWSVASLFTLPRCLSYQSPPSLDVTTQTFSHTDASRDVSTQLSFMESLASPSTLDSLCPACARPVPSLLLDMAVQTLLHSVATHDASKQQPLTEFFIGCILSNDPLDRQGSSSAHCNTGSASPSQPPDIATLCSPSSASHASDGYEDTTAPCALPQPPPGLERYAHVKAAPVRPRLCTSISVTLPTATCQCHPSGDTSHAFSCYIQEKCKYRLCGNPQSCLYRSSCRDWSFS